MLEARDLQVGYGRKTILSDINLTIQPGDWIGLVGPNGSGKTTLLRSLCGLLPPAQGAVFFGDKDIYTKTPDVLARLFAYLPQVPNQTVAYDVEEMVALGRAPYHRFFSRAEKNIIQEILEIFKLTDLAGQPVAKLSGGQFQRVILARTLAQTPRILFLDEPTAHLDPGQGIEILALIKSLLTGCLKIGGLDGRPQAVVAAFHDLNLAGQFASQISLINQGKIVRSGAPDQVLTEENLASAFGPHVHRRRDAETGRTFYLAFPS